MPFPLSYGGEVRVRRQPPERLLRRLEWALGGEGVRGIHRGERDLAFKRVSFDRDSMDLFATISGGSITIVEDSYGSLLRYKISFVTFFLFTTLIWPVVGALTHGPLDVLVLLWAMVNIVSYVRTPHRFEQFLIQLAG